MTETAPTPEFPAPAADPLVGLAMQPWRLAEVAHDLYLAWFHGWVQLWLWPPSLPHPHEAPEQLEVPDPIEAEGEDLFA